MLFSEFSRLDRKLVIDPEEAEVVRRIFNYYIQDKTPTQIVDILNSEGIPCPFWSRLKDAAEKRKDKGLSPKTYRRGAPDNMRWHANNINRIVKNTVYIGKRHFTFYEPDPANPTPAYKRTDRHILTEFDVESPELRIIDDETFAQANAVIESRGTIKNVRFSYTFIQICQHLCFERQYFMYICFCLASPAAGFFRRKWQNTILGTGCRVGWVDILKTLLTFIFCYQTWHFDLIEKKIAQRGVHW